LLRLVTFLLLCLLVGAVFAYGEGKEAGQPPAPRPPAAGNGNGKKAGAGGLQRLNYRRRVLPNGLTVYSVRSGATPTVAIQVWYHVGSKNDPEGRSGFAHLFEHLMFKSTRNMPSETMDRLTEDVGGENNAFTSPDVTVYHETVPSHYLETLLWAEAERMGNLAVNAANFASERAVVQEEYRQGVLAEPYGRLDVLINERSFVAHPYRRDTIGSIPDLDAASLEDVRNFHRTYYRPDNATLVVVGDFDDAQFDAWVDRYFGRVPKPSGDIPRVTVREPARTGERRHAETAPNVPLPALAVTYLVPPLTHRDADALRLAEVLLASGESSRLHRSLVYEQGVASEADADADLRVEAGLFTFHVTAAGGKSLDAAEKALFAQIERLQNAPVGPEELRKARNLLLAATLSERETNEEIAFALGSSVVLQGDPERVNTDIARLQAVTAEDVRRVAKAYFTPANRVVIRYEAGKDGVTTVGEKPATATTGATPEPTAPEGQEKPPAPGKPRPAAFPTPVERRLPNGLRVIVVPRPGSGLVSAEMVVRTGGASDPANKGGLASLTAGLLTRGAGGKRAPILAEEIESLGASVEGSAGWDGSFVTLLAPRANLATVTPLFSAVIRRPDFADEEVGRLRDETLDDLQVDLQSPGTLAALTSARVVYGDGPYGHPLEGTPESVRRLTRADVTAFHTAHYHPGNAVLVVGGDITTAEGFALAEKAFGTWKARPERPTTPPKSLPAPRGGRVVVIDKPDAGQSAVYLIRPGITATDPDYYPALVAESVYGGGFSSRLNQEIRIRRGLSYGAFSRLSTRRVSGALSASAQTKHETAPEVAGIFRDELARLATAPLPETELTPRKAVLTGGYARELETGAGLVGEVAELALYGRPLSELGRYLPSVEAVTAESVKTFAARRLPASDASIVIVGDGKVFLPVLRQKFPNVEVIPADRLDLNRAGLVRE
jgi:zinc protease